MAQRYTISPGGRDLNNAHERHTSAMNDDTENINETSQAIANRADDGGNTRIKRTACILCRKRKLRCDGGRPSCATCSRLTHECKYDETRKKSGPKRGYVKALEARLAQVETMLKTQDTSDMSADLTSISQIDVPGNGMASTGSIFSPEGRDGSKDLFDDSNMFSNIETSLPTHDSSLSQALDTGGQGAASMYNFDESATWDMIALGLEEPLPEQEIIDELTELYFKNVYPTMPMIHRARFLAAMELAPQQRPPVCLRYAMWALAAQLHERYGAYREHFYQRARHYLDLDEMRSHGENLCTLSHCQTTILLAVLEFKQMYFPRGWMSTGRAVRLAHMLGLHRLDGQGLDVKQVLPLPKDWTEREERRRTFWAAYNLDRCASVGTGWPMTIEEKDILTNLPSTEDAFQYNRPAPSMALFDALESKQTGYAPWAGTLIMIAILGRNLIHLHRPSPDDREDDLNGKFWERHRAIDGILLNLSLKLPDHLRLPMALPDTNVIFFHMGIHTSTICLHQAAIFKAEKNSLPASVLAESKMRCMSAAVEIAGIMRLISHLELGSMHAFMPFCLYVAARVFVQYLKVKANDQQITASLHFLLSAMDAMKRKNPLTESFLAQLEVDLESAGMPNPNIESSLASVINKGVPEYQQTTDAVKCAAVLHNDYDSQATSQAPSLEFSQHLTSLGQYPPYDVSHISRSTSRADISLLANVSRAGLQASVAAGHQSARDAELSPEHLETVRKLRLFEYHRIPQSSFGISSTLKSFDPTTTVLEMDRSPEEGSAAYNSSSNQSQHEGSTNTPLTSPEPTSNDITTDRDTNQPCASADVSMLFSADPLKNPAPGAYMFQASNLHQSEYPKATPHVCQKPPTSGAVQSPVQTISQAWENGGMEMTAGMTPDAESWGQILESMAGWESGAPIGLGGQGLPPGLRDVWSSGSNTETMQTL